MFATHTDACEVHVHLGTSALAADLMKAPKRHLNTSNLDCTVGVKQTST